MCLRERWVCEWFILEIADSKRVFATQRCFVSSLQNFVSLGGRAQLAPWAKCGRPSGLVSPCAAILRSLIRQIRPSRPLKTNKIESLTTHYKLQYTYCDTKYEACRENPLPARGRRLAARAESADDAAGAGAGSPQGAGQEHQPVLYFADRGRFAAAYDARVAGAAGEVFQSASGISGG